MKLIKWDTSKNLILKSERGICFEDVIYYIENGKILDIIQHPNHLKYPDQKIFLIKITGYVYLIPFIETKAEIFLKTIIPSRKATQKYSGGGHEKETN